jgi:hypothetical protein
MNTKTKALTIVTILSAALFFSLSASRASVATTVTPTGATKTTIRVNGLSADVLLVDGDTLGFLNASRDEIANTSALDFSYARPDATDPAFVILIQSAGAIPNNAFTIDSTSAHLAVATSFEVTRCDVNIIEGTFICAPTTPVTFDLTWVRNGFTSVHEKLTRREETLGPLLSTKIQGEFDSVSATVNGTFGGHTSESNSGNLLDTKSHTILREITLAPNP